MIEGISILKYVKMKKKTTKLDEQTSEATVNNLKHHGKAKQKLEKLNLK